MFIYRHTLPHYSFHSLLRKLVKFKKTKREENIHYQMAPCRTMVLLCLVLFLAASSTSTRIGVTTVEMKNKKSLGFKRSYIFGYLPKGVPIPPSAPSNRHNSLVDSLPHWFHFVCFYVIFVCLFCRLETYRITLFVYTCILLIFFFRCFVD